MAMCARKELVADLKRRREVFRKERVEQRDEQPFDTLRGRLDRDLEKIERKVIARQQISGRLKETERGMLIAR